VQDATESMESGVLCALDEASPLEETIGDRDVTGAAGEPTSAGPATLLSLASFT